MKRTASYLEYLREKELAEATCQIYVTQIEKFLDYVGPRKLTKDEVLSYKKILSGQSLSTATVNLYLIAINGYLRYEGHSECAVRTVRVQRKSSAENVLSREEYQALLDYARKSGREKYYHIMRILAVTGIRISELQFFTVEALRSGKLCVYNKGKLREVYLPESLIRDLSDYCERVGIRDGIIFRGRNGGPINRVTVYKTIVYLADMVGIPKEKAHPHSFRHLFAVTYMKQYANIAELADLLGHASIETTRIYTLASREEKRRRLDELGL